MTFHINYLDYYKIKIIESYDRTSFCIFIVPSVIDVLFSREVKTLFVYIDVYFLCQTCTLPIDILNVNEMFRIVECAESVRLKINK